jgi:hypothetical protein
MIKQKRYLWFVGLVLLAAMAACRLSGTPTATPVPTPIPTLVGGGQDEVTAVSPSLPTPIATFTPVQATAVPDASTDTPATATTPATAVATATTVAQATAAATAVPVGSVFGPGQQDQVTLEPGGFKSYSVQGVQFQPLLFFAETANDGDLLLATVAGENPAITSLDAITPLAEADFSPAARPEVMIYSPDADGLYTLVVGNQGPAVAETAVYLFDTATDSPLATHYRDETLAAGASKSYAVQSNGGRPVIAFVDPQDQSDLVLRFKDAAGSVLTEANFSGPGSAETAFVLPLRTTDYIIEISAATGGAATFTLVVVALE